MASTRLKNLPGEYLRERRVNQDINNYKMDVNKKIPVKSVLPDLGINPGNMSNSFYHNTLSNNTCDIESNLMGINSSNLVQKKSEFQPRLNTLPFKPFFELPNRFIPEPMVVNNKQRPAGPFTNN
tara:strand:- start:1652 stop:2026 length:375 start_codon:yes stop_codon:yes gene_type:complete